MSELTAETITPHLAAITLHHFSAGGYPASGGGTKLLDAITHLDDEHGDALALGFPGLVAAVRLARVTGGTAQLTMIATADRLDAF